MIINKKKTLDVTKMINKICKIFQKNEFIIYYVDFWDLKLVKPLSG